MTRTATIILSLFLLSALAGGLVALAGSGGDPPTELYVRTVPAGAKVFIDGKEVGVSDNLFEVKPGTRKVKVDLAGYKPAVKKAIVPESRIERVIFELVKKKSREGATPVVSGGFGLPIEETHGWLFQRMSLNEVLWRIKTEYDSLVDAYSKKDLIAVDKHAEELEELISFELIETLGLPRWQAKREKSRAEFEKVNPGKTCHYMEYRFQLAQRRFREIQSSFPDKRQFDRFKISVEHVLESSGDLHQCLRTGGFERLPEHYATLRGRWEVFWKQVSTGIPDVDKFEPANTKKMFFPAGSAPAGSPEYQYVLDLASGKVWSIRSDFAGLGEEFTKKGAGDLIIAPYLACLRGGKVRVWDGEEYVDLSPERKTKDITYYSLPTLPCRLRVATPEGKHFEVKVVSITDAGVRFEYGAAVRDDGATAASESGGEAPERTVVLPDADTPDTKVILDLRTGEMFEAPEKGGPEVFTKLGKGDLFFDRFLGCLRGGKAQKWDGGQFVEMEPKETKGDASAYEIPFGSCRLLITTAENRRFEVTVLSVDKKGNLKLTYRKVRPTSGKTVYEAVLERVEDHYDALVKAYENEDWKSVDHHANEMSDLIRDEIMVGFKLDRIRELLKKRKPGEDSRALTRVLKQAERIHEDLESICKSKAERDRLQTLLQSVEDYGDELHDSIRDGKIDQAPVRYAALAKAWEAVAREVFAKPGERKDNILANPGVESGDKSPDAWEQGASIPGVTYSWDNDVVHAGKASLCIEKTADRYSPIAGWFQEVDREGDAPTVELSAYVKAEKMTKAVLDVVFLDKDGEWISHKWAAYIGAKESGDPPADHDWKKYSGKIEVPPGTVKYRVGLQVYGPGKVWFDDVRLHEIVEEADASAGRGTPEPDSGDEGQKRARYLQDADTRGAKVVLDLESGEMLAVPPDQRDPTVFTRMGKGDICFDRLLVCLRGAKAKQWDGNHFVAMHIEKEEDDCSGYKLPPLPCRLLITTAEGEQFEVTAQATTKEGGLKLIYWRAGSNAVRPEEKPDGGAASKQMIELVEDFLRHNFRDISNRETIEWGVVEEHEDGSRSIRYMYLATIWGEKKLVMNQMFTFDANGKYVKYENVKGFPKGEKSNGTEAGTGRELYRRLIGKKVEDFPEKRDLSTPESAWAAYTRASGNKDAEGVVALSWVKIDPAEMKRFWTDADPEDIAVYNQAQLNSECIEVLTTSREELAAVISRLEFPPGKGRHPYSVRLFGRIDGKWKNLGEDRCPTLEAARENAQIKAGWGKPVKPGEDSSSGEKSSATDVSIEIGGPLRNLVVGKEATFEISLTNNTKSLLKSARIDVDLPNSFRHETLDLSKTVPRDVGVLEVGKTIHVGLRVKPTVQKDQAEFKVSVYVGDALVGTAKQSLRVKASDDASAPPPVRSKAAKTSDPPVSTEESNLTAAPRPVKITPEIAATDVAPDIKEIRVTFDRDMDTAGMAWCGGGPHFPKIDGKGKWIDKRTCVLPVKLEEGKAYRLALNWEKHQTFRSTDGVPVAPTAVYFCTKGANPELLAQMKPPKVVNLSIENGTEGVPPGRTNLSVTFDQPMGSGMSWCNGDDTPKFEPVDGEAWSEDKKTCSIMAVLEPGHDYVVYLNSAYYGNFMNEVGVSSKSVVWRFSTAGEKAEEPEVGKSSAKKENPNPTPAPRPVNVTPEIGATDVDPALKEIRVTFDRDMDTGGMAWCGGGPHFPKIDGKGKWIDKRTCVLPVKLEEGKAYRLAINWERYRSFRSADRVPVMPTAVYFCTKGASPELVAQMKPPKVVKLSIENGAKDVPPGQMKLAVTFDQPMGEGMSWCRNGVKSVGEPVWGEDKKTCSFTAVLEPGRDYRIRLNPPHYGNFMNEVGVSLEPVVWTFSTAGKKTEASEAGKSTTKTNLLKNPGAESGDKTPDAWEQGAAIPGVTYSWDKNVAHEGKASLRIEKTAQRYFPIATWSQDVERTGDAPKVELSAQVKAEKMTKAVLDVVFLDKSGKWISHKWAAYIGAKKSGDPPADHDWKAYSGRIKVPDGTVTYRVSLQVYGPGKVWFDDVRLEAISTEEQTPIANPHPVKIVPEVGATDVDPGLKEIRVTFDRDMDTNCMSWCRAGEHFPKVDGGGQWTDQRTCVLPVKLEKGKAYRLALNWEQYRNFRSAEGVPVTPTAIYFCTKGASAELVAQMTPPKIVSLSIENGAKDVPPGKTKLSVTFDQPMGEGMSWCNGKDTPELEPVKGSAWSKDKTTCSIMAMLEPGRDYVVYLNSAYHGNFMNEVGVSLEPVVWRFSTRK